MEPTRELDQIRSELNNLHDRTTTLKVELAATQAVTEQKFSHLLDCLEAIRRDIETMNGSIVALQDIANQGRTSIKTLLWVGGAIASIVAFILMIISYFPK